MIVLAAFALLFVLVLPGYMALRYGNIWYPLDFYRMPQPGGDYLATHAAAERWLSGKSVYTIPDSVNRIYSYPIVHVILFSPLSLFPLESSYRIWTCLSAFLILASLGLASTLFPRPKIAFLLGFVLYASSSFVLFQFERGQTDACVLFLITLFLFFYLKGYSKYLTASVFVLAVTVKIFPAIWGLFFLLRKEFRLLLIAALMFVSAVVLTDASVWLYYLKVIVPTYSGYYLGYTVDHSLFYFIEAFIPTHATALKVAKLVSAALIVCYSLLVVLNRHRGRHVLIEIAMLTMIMEISTPWAANYKLVLLMFAFLSPLSVLSIDFVARRPVLFTLPIFACLALITPLFGDYFTRLPYTLFALLNPSHVIAANPLHPVFTERKVALGILLLLSYLMMLYACSTINQYLSPSRSLKFSRRLSMLVRPRIALPLACVLLFSAIGALWLYNAAQRASIKRVIEATAARKYMGPAVSAIGYRLSNRGSGYDNLDLVFRVREPLPRNYQVYVHLYGADKDGNPAVVSGKNFFPELITDSWPRNKTIVTRTTLPMPPDFNEIHVGFFDLADGSRYGPEAVFTKK